MRRRELRRLLLLAGAASTLVAAGSVASVTLLGDGAGVPAAQRESNSGHQGLNSSGTAPVLTARPALASNGQGGQPATQDGTAGLAPAAVQPAGPSVFELQARQQQESGGQISAGPSTFEQQIRSQVPKPGPIPPITRGAGPPHWP
jgi:hypothetical protein